VTVKRRNVKIKMKRTELYKRQSREKLMQSWKRREKSKKKKLRR
jgi:hypothetical protein